MVDRSSRLRLTDFTLTPLEAFFHSTALVSEGPGALTVAVEEEKSELRFNRGSSSSHGVSFQGWIESRYDDIGLEPLVWMVQRSDIPEEGVVKQGVDLIISTGGKEKCFQIQIQTDPTEITILPKLWGCD